MTHFDRLYTHIWDFCATNDDAFTCKTVKSSSFGNSQLDHNEGTDDTMRVFNKKTLREYWEQEPRSKDELLAWYSEAENADWKEPSHVKDKYKSASILKSGRVVFNICGNNYRLVTHINYKFGMIYICFIGTHEEYDEIDAQTVEIG